MTVTDSPPVDPTLEVANPPDAVRAELAAFSAQLDAAVPAKLLDRNLLVGTWNVRVFGDLTKKWRSEQGDSPQRDLRDLCFIAEVLSRFDVVAVQEVRDNLRALRYALRRLGPDWGVILTDVTKGSSGNNERLAFLYDTRRVKPSGLAGELVVPVERDPSKLKPDAFNRQFARTPYAVSFVSAGQTFILVTLHVDYGKKPADRIPELKAIAEWLASWAEQEADWHHNLILLGDFNIDRMDDPLYQAFTSTGLQPAPKLNDVPRSVFDTPGHTSFFDQIAWFTDAARGPVLTLECTNAGSFDFVPLLIGDGTVRDLSFRISDHYPLWSEFSVRAAP